MGLSLVATEAVSGVYIGEMYENSNLYLYTIAYQEILSYFKY